MRLQLEPDMEVVGEAENGKGALAAVHALDPDVLVMDQEMPVMNGIATTRALDSSGSRAAVVMLSIHDSSNLRREATAAGVCQFVCKHEPSESLLTAIRDAAGCRQRREGTS
jgi:DNA-binding NarL/FixJ family response regulator